MTRLGRLGIALLACWWSSAAGAETAALPGDHQQLEVNLTGGLPERWVSCAARCSEGAGAAEAMLGPGERGNRLQWDVPGDREATRALQALEYTGELDGGGHDPALTLISRESFQGMRLIHRYVLSRAGYTLAASLQVPVGARLVLESGEAFVPEPLSGLASIYSDVDAVQLTSAGQTVLRAGEPTATAATVAGGQWVGVRTRFWALLLRPASNVTVDVRTIAPNRPRLGVEHGQGDGRLNALFYAGPVEWRRLAAVDPALGGLLFAGLWNWLRLVSFGLLRLLDGWHGLVGSYGVAVLLLSASVRLLTWPLTVVAERWQHEVERIQSVLKPELDAVRRGFRGEDAHRRTLEVYRRHGVNPVFAVRSALGVLIQLPIFVAAFDMLGQSFGLHGASFLWIGDLARPDRWIALPAILPWLGGDVHLLPFLMTGFSLAATRLRDAAALSPARRVGQRWRLYALAVTFFVLLYPFPAGMVLYWTANNLWQVLRGLAGRFIRAHSSDAHLP